MARYSRRRQSDVAVGLVAVVVGGIVYIAFIAAIVAVIVLVLRALGVIG